MPNIKRLILVLVAMLFVSGSLPVLAQEQNVVQGQLVRVDSAAKMIVIRTQSGSQMQFEYNDDTMVNGANETVAGLGTQTGTQVTVQYEKQETRFVATQVDIHKSEPPSESPRK